MICTAINISINFLENMQYVAITKLFRSALKQLNMCRKSLTYDIVHLDIAQGRHRGWQLAREQATKHKMYTYAKYVQYVEITKKVIGLYSTT